MADRARVSRGLFDAIGVPIVRGRGFTEQDVRERSDVAVVSEAFARRYWPNEQPLGKQLRLAGRAIAVVGIAHDIKVRTLGEAPRPMVYLPFSFERSSFVNVVVRTSVAPEGLLSTLERTALDVDPDLWLLDLTTMREHLGIVLLPARFSASVLSVLAAEGAILGGPALAPAQGAPARRRGQQ